jgi:hypothetical protein
MQRRAQDLPTAYCWSGEAIRSRSVSDVILCGVLDVPAPPARLVADWERDIAEQLGLEPGDVETLSLARARMRWPQYHDSVQAVADWTRLLGLNDVLGASELALMACRGTRYHQDAEHYGGVAFCNLFLSEEKGLDLHFPRSGQRIPLTRGTAVVFDTAQAHAVVARHRSGFVPADFACGLDVSLVFLTWELSLENALVASALGIAFDTDPATARLLHEEQVWCNGARVRVCQQTGCWRS